NDETHYITTHEIQLCELDHDVDYEFGLGSWDFEDDNLMYSFVDYASFDSDETVEGLQIHEEKNSDVTSDQNEANNTDYSIGKETVSTKSENDTFDEDKCSSSEESLSRNQIGSGNSAGQIHLSIKTTSRAINDSSSVEESENTADAAKHAGDMNVYVCKKSERQPSSKRDKNIKDDVKCFIALPGRLHHVGSLHSKEFFECSSGASSAVSELDDADKEVKNLTARAFRSLAFPYFDTFHFSSSDSSTSLSDQGVGINRWSTYVDLKGSSLAQLGEQHVFSHKDSASMFGINKNGAKVVKDKAPFTQLNKLQTKSLGLIFNGPNGKISNPENNSKRQVQLKEQVNPAGSSVITLTETLNFRCNVNAGVPENEGRAKTFENASGSRSMDKVTETLPREQGNEASKQTCKTGEAMEGTQKKSRFASSLLKNVISKKMQFEQELKMERGEIVDSTSYPGLSSKEFEFYREKSRDGDSRGFQRQNSKFSEGSSEYTIVSLEDLGDFVESKQQASEESSQKDGMHDTKPNNFESSIEAVCDSKIGVSETAKGTLLRSQNSAFRSWRDSDVEKKEEKIQESRSLSKVKTSSDHQSKVNLGQQSGVKATKMSHLFVPSIHQTTKENEAGKQAAIYINDTVQKQAIPVSPEIKISLRSIKETKQNPFNIAKLLTPKIGSTATNLIKTADDTKCQTISGSLKGELMEKVPQFTVRDVRENKYKMQAPIHQVRDVRKLVKSSYQFVSLNSNCKGVASSDKNNSDQKPSHVSLLREPSSVSPIVIKCHSVNTKEDDLKAGIQDLEETQSTENNSEVGRTSPVEDTILVHRTSGRIPVASSVKSNKSEPDMSELKTESRAAKWKQEKPKEEDKKPDFKVSTNQIALEKLTAAVKTMEQLYVFNKNEWKRKTKPRPILDSHVLSLIASQERTGSKPGESKAGCEREEEGKKSAPGTASVTDDRPVRREPGAAAEKILAKAAPRGTFDVPTKKEVKEPLKTFHIPINREEKDRLKALPQGGANLLSNKGIFTFGHSQKAAPAAAGKPSQPCYWASQLPSPSVGKSVPPKSPQVSRASRGPPAQAPEESQKANGEGEKKAAQELTQPPPDHGNYLTIPVKIQSAETRQQVQPAKSEQPTLSTPPSVGDKAQNGDSPQRRGKSPPASSAKEDSSSSQSARAASIALETRSPEVPAAATIYHHSLPITVHSAQPQIICFSPPMTAADQFQQTQRKMLLDPTTGQCYLVDTPVPAQPVTRRLFDPETGQYVEVPIPQQPVTPVSVPVSPIALSPGAYGTTYMIYPSFLPTTTVLPARTLQTQLSHPESEQGPEVGKASNKEMGTVGKQIDLSHIDSPYYIPTGKSANATQTHAHHITARGSVGLADGKPVISITSQQGPRIVAPPSFDGTTMSFVVEHR
uniref:Chromosome 4 open reading frame 54 n=1 Tax=Latimeria chalumnae TaxID=7897 RepID=H3AEF9_LATCH